MGKGEYNILPRSGLEPRYVMCKVISLEDPYVVKLPCLWTADFLLSFLFFGRYLTDDSSR